MPSGMPNNCRGKKKRPWNAEKMPKRLEEAKEWLSGKQKGGDRVTHHLVSNSTEESVKRGLERFAGSIGSLMRRGLGWGMSWTEDSASESSPCLEGMSLATAEH